MAEPSTTFELLEPSAPEALVPAHGLWPWLAGVAGLALLVVVIIVIRQRRKRAAASPMALRQAAFNEAVAALARVGTTDIRQAAVQCSLILRHYLCAAVQDPALFETHEEFLTRHDSLQALTPAARTAAAAGFARLAALKYAPDLPPMTPDEIGVECRALLETLHRGLSA